MTPNSTTDSRSRSVRTVTVMSCALAVVSTTAPAGRGAAAVITGVRSGARHTVAAIPPVARATATSGRRRGSVRSR